MKGVGAVGLALVVSCLVAPGLGGCCPVARPPAASTDDANDAGRHEPEGPRGEAWRRARSELADLRARFAPLRAGTLHVKLAMQHGATGRRLEARGAVAVGQTDGLRMILLGPGGTTALDLWMCDDEFKYLVPALEMERRGHVGDVDDGQRGFPVAFLRWWFLDRLDGRLLSFADDEDGRRYVLRDDGRVLSVRGGDELSVARGRESLIARGGDCGQARYHHAGLGLTIEVTCERVDEGAPPARAFADPDDPGRACRADEEGT